MGFCAGWAVVGLSKASFFAQNSKIAEERLPSGISSLEAALQ